MTSEDPQFEALLAYLKESRGFDFTDYKRASLMRRVARRMAQVDAHGYGDYLDHLQVHPDEFTALFNTILINVTSFFRDPEAWAYLSEHVVPALLAEKDPDAPIRVWSAGCASGEEAYTIAILLAELIGVDQFRRRVKIYATDVDEEALAEARLATYTDRQIAGLPAHLVQRHFESTGGRHVFRKDLRRSLIFGRNDLIQDAPISRVDILTCRNALMYFNAEAQSRILSRLHFALADGGVLFLGKAEMLLSRGDMFTSVDLKRRIFRKAPVSAPRAAPAAARPAAAGTLWADGTELLGLDRLRDEAFATCPVAQVVVTVDGVVALTNRRAETLLGVSTRDVGRPFRDLELSYRPVELRGYIDQAQVERRTVRVPDVEFVRPGLEAETTVLRVDVNPLSGADAGLLGVALVFQDRTEAGRLRSKLDLTTRQAETAYEELQSTNEELETTNEELQSSVEELETTNEELQSTNEELETTNEELQSTNDELQTLNSALRDRTAELHRSRTFQHVLLASLPAGVAVVDSDLQIQAWNRNAEDLWGLREEEALGEHLLNLDMGLPTDGLRPLLRSVLSGESTREQMTVEAINRRGHTVKLQVVCVPLADHTPTPDGAIMVMTTDAV
ncbi:two-component system CheB/CheR fusion protein [Actinoplanes octamycinicus]|uniref:protein-glutamate O-methyltransferase n=1 Tax=Actinoplanes octamycinicus TaxID=135948 RepID=A0A7W7H4S5_9ACTN|nr:CheR family methyltransferase [Actinoplanes octamycinicus]MBB4743862.1 two-component system CheB/CheR fusion protein [Actinoplanes octamycinicus]GIE58491.1 chemotaxis protein CheR [Actinoplanes octamycinicus]